MSRTNLRVALCLLLLCSAVSLMAQQAAAPDSVVPSLMKFTGTLVDTDGKPLTGTVGVTFLLYKEQTGSAPLWMETQNVQADKNGRYSVMLGSASAHGLPPEVFVAGEARWLGVQASGQAEQPRTLLLSVPYALKALDAETLGGKPASAFMVAPATGKEAGQAGPQGQVQPLAEQSNEIVCSSTTACKSGFVALFSSNGGSAKVSDSIVSQSGSNLAIAGSESVTSGATTPAVLGTSTGSSGTSNGVEGVTSSATASGVAGVNNGTGWGVYGSASGTSSTSIGVEGVTKSPLAFGVAGINSSGTSGIGVYGLSSGTSGDAAGVWGTATTGYAPGVEGVNTSTAANATGIYGYANSFGVEGSSPSVGVRGFSSGNSGATTGVQGFSSSPGQSSAGVYGQAVVPHASTFPNMPPAGVWGDSGLNGGSGGVGVLGTVDDHIAGLFFNNAPSGWWTLSAGNYDSSGFPFIAWNNSNNTSCNVDPGGNLNCTGQKHAIVPIDGGMRKVAMSSIEAPQSWFEDAGSTHLVNGAAIVTLDRDFMQTVNTEMEYNVFLTPYGDCKGLYVTNRTTKTFEVHELGGGTASVGFGYRIMALRRNYENVRFEDHTKDPDPRKMLERMGKARTASAPAPMKPASLPTGGLPMAQLSNK